MFLKILKIDGVGVIHFKILFIYKIEVKPWTQKESEVGKI